VELRHQMIEANHLRMRVAEQGTGPTVLLCHGFPETSYAWRHQMPALAAAGFHAVAPDLRGYGGTDRPEEIDRYTVLHLIGDMVGLLDGLGAATAVIVGNDWGATLAWQAALLRPDRFQAVVAMGVPMMGRPPMPPTELFPQTDDAVFYTRYFQPPNVAEAELQRNVRETLRRILFAASGEAGPRRDGDGTPNPFGMVSQTRGQLSPLPSPSSLPSWLTEADLDVYVSPFAASGFRGGLNYYRNLDRNWELQASLNGMKVERPALYMVGERDIGLSIPGMREIIADMPALVPDLRGTLVLADAGHWLPQEHPQEVNSALLSFLADIRT